MISWRLCCVFLVLIAFSAVGNPGFAEIIPGDGEIFPNMVPEPEIAPQIQLDPKKEAVAKRIGSRLARAIGQVPSASGGHSHASNDATVGLVEAVSLYVNEFSYIPDYDTYGEADHWATIDEFLEAGGGDSEDFALAKYVLLLRLGLNPQKLFIVARHDTTFESICHMYLMVEVHGRYFAFGHRSEDAVLVDDKFMAAILFVASSEMVDVRNMTALQGVAFSW
ncbi:MAG: transglutaminase-like cysteine peptidase [Alphaproteobacteria bacterium]